MKTQKQLKLIAIESFANSLRMMDIFHTRSSEGLSVDEAGKVNDMVIEFKAHMVNRFAGTISKKSDKFAAKAAARQIKAEEKKAKLAEKEAKIKQKAEAKLAKDTLRAEKLAIKLEAAKAKVAAPAEMAAA